MQGSPYDAFGPKLAAAAYGWAGIDVAVPGNHEFDKGNGALYEMARLAPRVTWLTSNIRFPAFPRAPPALAARSVDAHGLCWASALTERTANNSSPDAGTHFLPAEAALRAALRGCAQTARVVAVTHHGLRADVALCRAVRELSLVIGGHSHSNLDDARYPLRVLRDDGSACVVATAYAYGRYMGVLDVSFGEGGGAHDVMRLTGSMYVALDGRIAPDADVSAKLAAFSAALDGSLSVVIGHTTASIDGSSESCRAGECALGNLVADALLQAGRAACGATLAIVNSGSLRASLPPGPVTMGVVGVALPFDNEVVCAVMGGAAVWTALEFGVGGYGTESDGRFPAVAGVRVQADLSAEEGARLRSVVVAGEAAVAGGAAMHELEAGRTYTVAMIDYIAGGGDGYAWGAETQWVLKHGAQLVAVVSDFLGERDPYAPRLDGRMVNVAGHDEL